MKDNWATFVIFIRVDIIDVTFQEKNWNIWQLSTLVFSQSKLAVFSANFNNTDILQTHRFYRHTRKTPFLISKYNFILTLYILRFKDKVWLTVGFYTSKLWKKKKLFWKLFFQKSNGHQDSGRGFWVFILKILKTRNGQQSLHFCVQCLK